MEALTVPMTVMTDCPGLTLLCCVAKFCNLSFVSFVEFWGSGAEAPIFALRALFQALGPGKIDLIHHVSAGRTYVVEALLSWNLAVNKGLHVTMLGDHESSSQKTSPTWRFHLSSWNSLNTERTHSNTGKANFELWHNLFQASQWSLRPRNFRIRGSGVHVVQGFRVHVNMLMRWILHILAGRCLLRRLPLQGFQPVADDHRVAEWPRSSSVLCSERHNAPTTSEGASSELVQWCAMYFPSSSSCDSCRFHPQ